MTAEAAIQKKAMLVYIDKEEAEKDVPIPKFLMDAIQSENLEEELNRPDLIKQTCIMPLMEEIKANYSKICQHRSFNKKTYFEITSEKSWYDSYEDSAFLHYLFK